MLHPTPPYPVPVPAIPAALPILGAMAIGFVAAKLWSAIFDD